MPFIILRPLNDFSLKNGFEGLFRKGMIRDLENLHQVGTPFDQLPDSMSNMPNSAFHLVKVGPSKGFVKISAS